MPEMRIVENNGLMTPQQAAAYLNIKLSSIYAISMKKIIPVCKVGKLIRFRRQDLDKFITDNMNGVRQ